MSRSSRKWRHFSLASILTLFDQVLRQLIATLHSILVLPSELGHVQRYLCSRITLVPKPTPRVPARAHVVAERRGCDPTQMLAAHGGLRRVVPRAVTDPTHGKCAHIYTPPSCMPVTQRAGVRIRRKAIPVERRTYARTGAYDLGFAVFSLSA
ncbi:hypothetical protein DFH06DRAFT_1344940 [Mycena polygramma]|nr:hypothetical protein DFH06DRAFT_1344940 [Mycena polygramma]